MKVLITGGAGYIGYGLVRQLMFVPSISEIVIYDNLTRLNYALFQHDKFHEKPIRFIQGDILDGRKLRKALEGVNVVYHLAAKVTTPFADVEAHSFDQINHWGTAQLALAIEQSEVEKVIYVSSLSAYGNADEPIDENHIPHPQSYYGISKLKGEKELLRLNKKVNVLLIRSGNVYGYNPAFRIDAVINRFVFEAHFKGKLMIHGSGEQQRSFIHVNKLTSCLQQLVGATLESGVYNFAEHNFSINELLGFIKELYPEVETVSVNPNMPRRNTCIQLPCKLWQKLNVPAVSFLEELKIFQTVFAFKSGG